LRPSSFKSLNQSNGISINGCDFLKFINSVQGGHCVFTPDAKTLATPLLIQFDVLPKISKEVMFSLEVEDGSEVERIWKETVLACLNAKV